MAYDNRIERRKHRGPWRFLQMSLSDFLKRFLGWRSAQR